MLLPNRVSKDHVLWAWWDDHPQYPFPNRQVVKDLAQRSKQSIGEVKDWFDRVQEEERSRYPTIDWWWMDYYRIKSLEDRNWGSIHGNRTGGQNKASQSNTNSDGFVAPATPTGLGCPVSHRKTTIATIRDQELMAPRWQLRQDKVARTGRYLLIVDKVSESYKDKFKAS